VCFTIAATKAIFVLIRHFWRQDIPHVKTYPASRCPQHQVSRVKLSSVNSVAWRCPASQNTNAYVLQTAQPILIIFFVVQHILIFNL